MLIGRHVNKGFCKICDNIGTCGWHANTGLPNTYECNQPVSESDYLMTYNIIFFVAISSVLLTLVASRNTLRSFLYYSTLLGLFVVTAFRFEVGCDWNQYQYLFNLYSTRSWSEIALDLDPGFYSVIKAIHLAGLPFSWVNIFCAGVFFAGLHAIARRQPSPISLLVLAFPILIINIPMSALRQACAIGIMCFAYLAFVDKKSYRFLLMTSLAFLFHSSAIVFALLWPLTFQKTSKKSFIATAVLAIPAAIFILSFKGADVGINRHVLNLDAAKAFGAPYRLALLTLAGAVFLRFFKNKWEARYPTDFEAVNLCSILMVSIPAIYLLALGAAQITGTNYFTSVVGDRFGYYLTPVQLVIISRLSQFYQHKISPLLRLLPYLLFALVLYTWTEFSLMHDRCYSPYQFNFEISEVTVSKFVRKA